MTNGGKKIVAMLADYWNKTPGSNISKVFEILGGELDTLTNTAEKVEQWRDIDQAKGKPLEQLAGNIDQQRGASTDEILRLLVKSKAARARSRGTIDDIIGTIAVSLDVEPSLINIEEMPDDPLEPEPAAIKMAGLPLGELLATGISPSQFGRIVKRAAAPGVKVASIELTGTFTFASGSTPQSSTLGFADVAETTGGTLSGLLIPDNDQNLPL
ncbi:MULTISPECIES: hypothetical protein [unclassified Exiguobacterium]|uniref:hypothetical protein n=1 Tax=unclassified Exiguobacterium TaxID=2644629 RepID=UPI001BE626A9|nr:MULTISPECIES: hypothetical protein [unclassified Exiguobacterium]MCM3281506.1 hypothetical protein [Exiguobacterium sp. MER 193]